jgi:hypothetical protein
MCHKPWGRLNSPLLIFEKERKNLMRKSLTLLITLALVVVGVQGFAQQSAYEYCTTFNQIKAQAIDSTATLYGMQLIVWVKEKPCSTFPSGHLPVQ